MNLFRRLISDEYFNQTPIILVFSHLDTVKMMLAETSFSAHHPDYKGSCPSNPFLCLNEHHISLGAQEWKEILSYLGDIFKAAIPGTHEAPEHVFYGSNLKRQDLVLDFLKLLLLSPNSSSRLKSGNSF